mmetsp:Transcript_34723/g.87301  ORF Transcript_34723/g.87301 Transcript_34723/m.87301 type:complete len:204 (-) Transcript_34723:580-1191(-)
MNDANVLAHRKTSRPVGQNPPRNRELRALPSLAQSHQSERNRKRSASADRTHERQRANVSGSIVMAVPIGFMESVFASLPKWPAILSSSTVRIVSSGRRPQKNPRISTTRRSVVALPKLRAPMVRREMIRKGYAARRKLARSSKNPLLSRFSRRSSVANKLGTEKLVDLRVPRHWLNWKRNEKRRKRKKRKKCSNSLQKTEIR